MRIVAAALCLLCVCVSGCLLIANCLPDHGAEECKRVEGQKQNKWMVFTVNFNWHLRASTSRRPLSAYSASAMDFHWPTLHVPAQGSFSLCRRSLHASTSFSPSRLLSIH